MQALDEAIAKCGTVTVFAQRIEVAQSTVSMWKARGRVPGENCPAIERETGVRCERLRPDIPWDVLRMQAGTEPVASEPWDGVERRTARPA
jgi:DNA-binding transcriptional regulator YdaS (Cro superfamily)